MKAIGGMKKYLKSFTHPHTEKAGR